MSYQTIKNYVVQRMMKHGFTESNDKFNLSGESEFFDNRFIVQNPQTDAERESVVDQFFVDRSILITVAKSLSEKGMTFEYDAFCQRIDNIIADIPNPTNYQSDIALVRYDGHIIEENSGAVEAQINFLVEDRITYAS